MEKEKEVKIILKSGTSLPTSKGGSAKWFSFKKFAYNFFSFLLTQNFLILP